MNRPASSVLTYYCYKSTKAVEFYRPVMFLYFLSQGLTFTEVALLEAIYSTTTVLGEVPTGYVGDRIGRRNSLLVGTVLIALTLVGLGLAGSFSAFAVLYALWSLAYTFRSGSDDAWLYDTLVDDRFEDRFAHVRGRGQSAALLVGVVGAVVGGYLGELDLAYPFFVAAGVTALGVPILFAMPEPEQYRETADDQPGVVASVRIVRETVSRPSLRAFVCYYFVLFTAVMSVVFMFVQPVLEAVALARSIGPVEPLLGWFYGAISLLSAGLSYHTGAIHDRFGLRRWFVAVPLLVGAGLVAIALVPVLAVPALLFARGVATTTRSLATQYVNDRIDTLGRATVLSAMAMVGSLAAIPFQVGAGALSDATSPVTALGAAGAVLVVGSALILAWGSPVRTSAGVEPGTAD